MESDTKNSTDRGFTSGDVLGETLLEIIQRVSAMIFLSFKMIFFLSFAWQQNLVLIFFLWLPHKS